MMAPTLDPLPVLFETVQQVTIAAMMTEISVIIPNDSDEDFDVDTTTITYTFDLLGMKVSSSYKSIVIDNSTIGSNIYVHFSCGTHQALIIRENTSVFSTKDIINIKETFPSTWRSVLQSICRYEYSFSASSEAFGSQVYTIVSSMIK